MQVQVSISSLTIIILKSFRGDNNPRSRAKEPRMLLDLERLLYLALASNKCNEMKASVRRRHSKNNTCMQLIVGIFQTTCSKAKRSIPSRIARSSRENKVAIVHNILHVMYEYSTATMTGMYTVDYTSQYIQ